jgi:hypothetical protein
MNGIYHSLVGGTGQVGMVPAEFENPNPLFSTGWIRQKSSLNGTAMDKPKLTG